MLSPNGLCRIKIGWRIGHNAMRRWSIRRIYVAAMYALAFVYNDIEFIVEEALKSILRQSKYYQCMMLRC